MFAPSVIDEEDDGDYVVIRVECRHCGFVADAYRSTRAIERVRKDINKIRQKIAAGNRGLEGLLRTRQETLRRLRQAAGVWP